MNTTRPLQCGYGYADITPRHPVVMDGFAARLERSTGVLDPLGMRVLALQDGTGNRCILVFLDLIGLNSALAKRITDCIADCGKIDSQHIVLLSSHTHAGPAAGILYGLEQDSDYWQSLLDQLPTVITAALRSLSPSAFDVVTVPLHIGVNRREMRAGRMVIGADAERPTDDCFRVLRIFRGDCLAGALCHASCHPVHLTANNTLISADYPAGLYQSPFVQGGGFALFANGGAGDINPLLYAAPNEQEALAMSRAQLSEALAAAIACARAPEFQSEILWCRSLQICIPIHAGYTVKELEQQLEHHQKKFNSAEGTVARYVASVNLHWYQQRVAELHSSRPADTLQVTVQLIGLGRHCAILALPFEAFVETQESLLETFRILGGNEKRLFVCSYANGVQSYLPPPSAVMEGGYEVDHACIWYDLPGKYTLDSEPALRKGCEELMRQYLLEVN